MRIGYCINCQPFDGGEPVWILGERGDLSDLLEEHEVPEASWAELSSALRCPNCGADLDQSDEVGLYSEHELAVRALWMQWRKRWEKRFQEFYGHLERYPYLGLGHDIGRRVMRAVRTLPVATIEDEKWYRARRVTDSRVLVASDFWPPDPATVEIPEGRYNHHGQALFYLADSREVAALEVLRGEKGVAWVQCVTVRRLAPVLDLAPDWHDDPDPSLGVVALALAHTGILSRGASPSASWKPEYFLPRFVADCTRAAGIGAIVFSSHFGTGRCLVAFDPDAHGFRMKGEPAVFRFVRRKDKRAGKKRSRA